MKNSFIGAYFWEPDHIPNSLYDLMLKIEPNVNGFIIRSENVISFIHWTNELKGKIQLGFSQIIDLCIVGKYFINKEIINPSISPVDSLVSLILSGKSINDLLINLDGEFSIMIWNKENKSLIIGADQVGRRIIYYYKIKGGIVWGSHPIQLAKIRDGNLKWSKEGINLYFALKGIPAPWSLFTDIYKLPSGHYLFANKNEIHKNNYWMVKNYVNKTSSFEEAQQNLRKLLINSIYTNVEKASEPLGLFLSGGLDSTIIATIAKKIATLHAFTVGYTPETYYMDESHYAIEVAKELKVPIHLYRFTSKDALTLIPTYLASSIEPIGDMAFLPQLFLANKAAFNVHDMFDGTGADALFGGSNKFIAENYRKTYLKLPKTLRTLIISLSRILPSSKQWLLTRLINKLRTFSIGSEISSWEERTIFWSSFFTHSDLSEILSEGWFMKDDIGRMILHDYINQYDINEEVSKITYMTLKAISSPIELLKISSIENESGISIYTPYLSHDLIEFVLSLPDSYKVNDKIGKLILRMSFESDIPLRIVKRSKANFNPPLGYWLTSDLQDIFWETMKKDKGFFKNNHIYQMWKQQKIGLRDYSAQLWAIFAFQFWVNSNY